MTHYIIPADPSTPHRDDGTVRKAAWRRGVKLHYDPIFNQWVLVEPRLRLPISDPLPSLAAVARLIYAIPLPAKRKRQRTNGRQPKLHVWPAILTSADTTSAKQRNPSLQSQSQSRK